MSLETDSFVDSIPFLSFQQNRILKEHAADMQLWQGKRIEDFWPADFKNLNKNEINRIYDSFIREINGIRKSPIDYSTFNPNFDFAGKKPSIIDDFKAPETIMGRCPCPSESDRLRCCNLKTLDAVQQCAFACAYCSIQSFYSKNEIRVVSDLNDTLEKMTFDSGIWHIGTGQSSDSLLLGDDYGTLTALFNFARKHPEIIIELKTKSSRTDWLKMDVPKNVISTWSVNAKTICEKEEHLASSQEARINAASKCAQKGHTVGFHVHPMVYFTDWKTEYADLVKKLCDNVDPASVAMVGIGTLTFTKANLRTLRSSGRPTRITQMPLDPIAGKYSYSMDTKKELFSYLYKCFPQDWKDSVFFYLCMEDKDLWLPCLGRDYPDNDSFERDMKKSYFAKIGV